MRLGTVESLWRYPVKSMRGEEVHEAFLGFAGVYGDRVYAFRSSTAPKGFPYFTGREQEAMLLFRPMYRHPERMTKPYNLSEAEALAPGINPVYADASDLALDVQTPSGQRVAIDDPRLVSILREGIRHTHELTLVRSDRAMTDCRPVSIFSTRTVRQLSSDLGIDVDKRRFRANIYVEFASGDAFDEDKFVGRAWKIGAKATIAVLERDPRCKMITLDPDTARPNPEIMRRVARDHDGKAGLYAAVVTIRAIGRHLCDEEFALTTGFRDVHHICRNIVADCIPRCARGSTDRERKVGFEPASIRIAPSSPVQSGTPTRSRWSGYRRA